MRKNHCLESYVINVSSGYSYSGTGDTTLIKNVSGTAACPQGKFCLFTNAGFNSPELGDVLAINPDVQLNSDDLLKVVKSMR